MYKCDNCWLEAIKWMWKCTSCGTFWSMKEKEQTSHLNKVKWAKKDLSKIENSKEIKNRFITSCWEFNNVLWWWIVDSSLILLTWEPWIWKSTLSLQIWDWTRDLDIIYVSWEETAWQISNRASRLEINTDNISILAENNLENILATLEENSSDLVIIDSISVIYSREIQWVSWSMSQVRFIAEELMNFAKKKGVAMVIIGHITKDWNVAWPKTLEHLVDSVLYFEWDKFDNLRILRSLKNRFWATSEIWLFKMEEKWLQELTNPWLEFANSLDDEVVWSALSMTIEWTRPLIIETESLTTYTKFWYPKRSTRWIISAKLDMLVAILWKYTKSKLDSYDVYTNISRWLKIDDPWIDLAICASIISSRFDKKMPKSSVFIGEISLTWVVKNVMNMDKRIKEAKKLWFSTIYCPKLSKKISWVTIIEIKHIWDLEKFII